MPRHALACAPRPAAMEAAQPKDAAPAQADEPEECVQLHCGRIMRKP